ncbi:MAG: hypothetical protein P4L84_04605 [Isosphaeraceae bacterium]|nr:hypothetical protein [Isosphaeraceae bacterium]
MDGRRKRFVAALALFFVWVATLAIVAVRSARAPVSRPAAALN